MALNSTRVAQLWNDLLAHEEVILDVEDDHATLELLKEFHARWQDRQQLLTELDQASEAAGVALEYYTYYQVRYYLVW